MIGNIVPSNDGHGIPHIDDMPTMTMNTTDRFEVVKGGYVQIGKKVYVNVILKLKFSMDSTTSDWKDRFWSGWDIHKYNLPAPANNGVVVLDGAWMQYNTYNHHYDLVSYGVFQLYTTSSSGGEIMVSSSKDVLDGTTNDIRCLIYGEYDV